jgi:hypothetical protein
MALPLLLLLGSCSPVLATRPTWLNSSLTTTIPSWQANASCVITSQGLFEVGAPPSRPANVRLLIPRSKMVDSVCSNEIAALQTCPGSGIAVNALLDTAAAFSDCFEKQYAWDSSFVTRMPSSDPGIRKVLLVFLLQRLEAACRRRNFSLESVWPSPDLHQLK